MDDDPKVQLTASSGVRVGIIGCGHGTLNAIYASLATSCAARSWPSVDILIIGGDFQAVRNARDLTVMSVPVKYRTLGDFHEYYSGTRVAPCLTLFVGGNHEAASHLWELYYGGWVAPNIYYLGAANVLRLGPLRIVGMSGIWKGFDYQKTHFERLPFGRDDIKSFYHIREVDVRKLLLIREPVDVGISHDWPRAIEKHGDSNRLFRQKPDFRQESADGTLGNVAASYVMDRLRPKYWFSAHLHCEFSAIKTYEAVDAVPVHGDQSHIKAQQPEAATAISVPEAPAAANPDEIDLDMDDEPGEAMRLVSGEDHKLESEEPISEDVVEDLRSQLPASFARPERPERPERGPRRIPGQPVPASITNTTVRFLALDKCLPGRRFLKVMDIEPLHGAKVEESDDSPRFRLRYDAEWLAITRAFASSLTIGDRQAQIPQDLGEEQYAPLIDGERVWIEEHVVKPDKLDVPYNFTITAPIQPADDFAVNTEIQPNEYTSPQTAAFCSLIGVPNLWDASEEEREERRRIGPPADEMRHNRGGFGGRGRGGGRGGGRGRGFGRGNRGRGRGRG